MNSKDSPLEFVQRGYSSVLLYVCRADRGELLALSPVRRRITRVINEGHARLVHEFELENITPYRFYSSNAAYKNCAFLEVVHLAATSSFEGGLTSSALVGTALIPDPENRRVHIISLTDYGHSTCHSKALREIAFLSRPSLFSPENGRQ